MGGTILVKRDRLEALQRRLHYLEPGHDQVAFADWLIVMQIIGAMLKRKDHEEPPPKDDGLCGKCSYLTCSTKMPNTTKCDWYSTFNPTGTRDGSAYTGAVPTVTTTAPHKWQEGMLRVDVENIPELVTRGEVEDKLVAAMVIHLNKCHPQAPNCLNWSIGEGWCVHGLKPCDDGCSFRVPREVKG